ARKAVNGAIALAEFPQRFHVDTVLLVQAATHLEDADDFVSGFRHEAGRVRTDVAETLHDDAGGVAIQSQFLDGLVADHEHAASSRLTAPARSADVHWLASHDRGAGLSHVHGVGIHDPSHGLLVGIHVGRGDVFFRADEFEEFRRVAAGHPLQLALRHFVWIADDATLGAAERNVHH